MAAKPEFEKTVTKDRRGNVVRESVELVGMKDAEPAKKPTNKKQ